MLIIPRYFLQENVADAGIIPFYEDEYGYNPGLILDLYLAVTCDENPRFFQRIRRPSNKWDLHSYSSLVWFEKHPCGKHKIEEFLKTICKLAGVDQLSNHSLRSTGIQALHRDGFSVHDICRMTGHKNPNNLKHYFVLTKMDKIRMATSLQHGHKTYDSGVYRIGLRLQVLQK